MQLIAQSEWMLDQKHAQVISPGKSFEVIQTASDTSVFFSIGSDNRFYACREVQAGSTGWTRINLDSNLLGPQDGRKVAVKSFAVAQNPDSLYFDLAVVATIAGSDQIFVSTGNANTDDAWSRSDGQLGVQWTALPFDAVGSSSDRGAPEIDAVYLMTLPTTGAPAGSLTCFVDVLRPAPNTLRLLDRYYLTPQSRPAWKKHTLPIDLAAGSISSSLGRRFKDRVAGIYTFGQINGRLELIYAPAFDFWDPNNPPAPVRLVLPDNASSIATAINSAGNSHLFVSGQQGVFYFSPDQQKDGSSGTRIITTDLVAQAIQLSAESINGTTALYGKSPQGDLFYTTCKAGSEASPEAWSLPVPLASQIEHYAFFLNNKAGNNSVFAHVTGQQITQITQDHVTRDWASRSILLPATDVNDIIEISAFTTRLTVQDNSGAGAAKTEVLLTATSPVGVYINDAYRILSPNIPIRSTSSEAGVIIIVQPTQDMSAISYKASVEGQTSVSLNIDPAEKVKARIAAVQSGNDLKNATITQSDGTTSSLIPRDVSQDDCDAAATTIQQLVKVASTLPTDGSPQKSSVANGARVQPAEQSKQILSLETPPHRPDARISITDAVIGSAKNIFVQAGDLFRSILHSAWNAVKNFVIRVANGIYEVLVQVGDAVYRTVLDCVSAVSHAVEWVFSKLKVAFDDLKAFLGFVFNWSDIVRTHKVIKNVATQYALYGVSRIQALQDFVTTSTDSLESTLNSWAGIPDLPVTTAQTNAKASEIPGVNNPQNYYVQDKVKSNIGNAGTDATSVDVGAGSDWASVLNELKGLATDEKQIVSNSLDQIKSQIIEPFAGLSPLDIVKRLVAIIGDLVLETAKNIVVKTLGIVKNLTSAVIEELNKPISIPIISGLYKSIAGDDLSIMDLVCLVAAVPATLIYKAVTGTNPFPDNASTSAIIEASDFSSLQQIMLGDSSVFKTLTIMAEFAAMAGLGFSVIANNIKIPWMAEGKPHEVSDIIKQVSIPIKLLVLMPGFIQPRSDHDSWEIQMDTVITDLAFLKVCLDATSVGEQDVYGTVSPYIDYAISALWIVPSIGKIVANHQKTSSYLSLTTRLAYDVAVMTGPIVWNPDLDPETKLIVLAVSDGLIIVTAGISVATGGLLQNND